MLVTEYKKMTNELYRGDLSDIAKIYTTIGFSKMSRVQKDSDSRKILCINKSVVKDGIQARVGIQPEDYSYVVVANDSRIDVKFLAFLINSSPWKIMLGDGEKYLEGINIPTSLSALKKLPVIILSDVEQSACAFLDTLITTTHDAVENEDEEKGDFNKVSRYLLSIRDYIALEIFLDGVLSSPDISVLSAWMEKKTIYDNTQDKKEAFLSLIKSIFSSNDELRDRMNKMRLFIDDNTDLVFNQFPQ